MNANKLADAIEKSSHCGYNLDAATMLRQLQALINQREDEIKAFCNLVTEQDKKIIDLAFDKVYAERSAEVVAELYTHPVKELTDEEILKMASDYLHYTEFKQGIQFARAILRKAQE
jgi:hypothetical protein